MVAVRIGRVEDPGKGVGVDHNPDGGDRRSVNNGMRCEPHRLCECDSGRSNEKGYRDRTHVLIDG